MEVGPARTLIYSFKLFLGRVMGLKGKNGFILNNGRGNAGLDEVKQALQQDLSEPLFLQ